jgi:hypothetical protein
LLFHNISTNLNGAAESLAPYKWCYELVAPFVRY